MECKTECTYRIGLDIGIGSVGWAVVSYNEKSGKLEDCGTRIFESGENEKKKSNAQERRTFRAARRLIRRRQYRRTLLLQHFRKIGLAGNTFFDEVAEIRDDDVFRLKVKGLSEKLSPAELYKCMIHTVNHRGYHDFYDKAEDDKSEDGVNRIAMDAFTKELTESGARTVSEYLLLYRTEGNFVKFRNHSGSTKYLIDRELMRKEAQMILQAQSRYYPILTNEIIEGTLSIMFAQRDFEDGPGTADGKYRRYHGSLEKQANCRFYPEEERGYRLTPLSDTYAFVNVLSQCVIFDKETGEISSPAGVMSGVVDEFLSRGRMTLPETKKYFASHGYELKTSGANGEKIDPKTFIQAAKFLPVAKEALEKAGLSYEDYIKEEQFDLEHKSVLFKVGELISKYQTPGRRKKELQYAGIDERLINAFSGKKISGTASVCYRYMCDAVAAYRSGDSYGNFQAKFLKNVAETTVSERYVKLPPAVFAEGEMKDNRVVMRSLSETRKVLNAIIDRYGSPTEIAVEVASELGKSALARAEDQRKNNAREKERTAAKEKIAELLGVTATDVSPRMVDVYTLYSQQGGKCLYSGEPLGELPDVLRNSGGVYEIDHIVPYSLILDNSLENKALVFRRENQNKGQKTPLMYLDAERRKEYIKVVKALYKKKEGGISQKKFAYLMCESLYGEKAEEILGGWKSRNINDTRYITKYIVTTLKEHLQFKEKKNGGAEHVMSLKGAVTARMRRDWFYGTVWGLEEKKRENYLNHAIDAVVIANLSRPYIEVASDAIRLHNLRREYKGRENTPEYDIEKDNLLQASVSKMQKYYGFSPEYTRRLLTGGKVPALTENLREEVIARFGDVNKDGESVERTAEAFTQEVTDAYSPFDMPQYPPHPLLVSMKAEKKYAGGIADENFVRIVIVDGKTYCIKRKSVLSLTSEDIPELYTGDTSLIRTLEAALAGKGKDYTVDKYLKENNLPTFVTDKGQPVRTVSLKSVTSNYYPVMKDGGNYANLSVLKYYCLEIYKNHKGEIGIYGLRYVDLVHRGGKLWQKPASRPGDYVSHVMYLFKNEYIAVTDRKGNKKFEGYYQSVGNINESKFNIKVGNASNYIKKSISKTDTVRKYSVSLLGEIEGEIVCSEPYALLPEKN